MAGNFEFNPVFGDDVGYLKQWIDVTLLFEDLTATVSVLPAFERTNYSAPYNIATNTNFEEVCAVLQNFAYNKHCRFGITITGSTAHWSLLGLTYRYRLASETLKA